MKTTIKSKQVTKNYYECDMCGRGSWFKQDIEQCEKSHTCNHILHYEFREVSDELYRFHTGGIVCKCRDCGEEFGFLDFENIESEHHILQAIYEWIYDHHSEYIKS